MKQRLKIICLSFILLAGMSFVSYGGAEQDQAKAVIGNSLFEFKPVLEGSEVVHDFIIQNAGKATLEIEKVETG